ncbi:MAG: hypothetical protein LBT38_12365 [Deltaproteobacteria bacterium]|nr:hypothetical protein [Deltaproteobacteria bacterium]
MSDLRPNQTHRLRIAAGLLSLLAPALDDAVRLGYRVADQTLGRTYASL